MSLTGKAESNYRLRGKISKVDVIHKDTYRIAVENGFEGTVDEWLASLKGEKGDPAAPIDDTGLYTDKTWSSNRIYKTILENRTYANKYTDTKVGEIINDTTVAEDKTWSSEKINSKIIDQIESYIKDEDEDPFSLWSSVKVKDYTDSKVISLIDDESIDPDGTWSSEKIDTALDTAFDTVYKLAQKSCNAYTDQKISEATSKQYELIEDFTLEKDAAIITRKKYPESHPRSGEPYDFNAIRVYVSIPDKSSVTAQIIFCTGTGSNGYYIFHAQNNGLLAGKASQAFFRAYNDGGFVNYDVAVSQNYTKHAIPSYIAKVWGNVDKLEISSNNSGNVFPAGTRIRIYGIRG